MKWNCWLRSTQDVQIYKIQILNGVLENWMWYASEIFKRYNMSLYVNLFENWINLAALLLSAKTLMEHLRWSTAKY